MAVVLLSVTETSGEGKAAFSGEFHSPKGGMSMEIACILLTLVPGTFLLSALQRIDVLKLLFSYYENDRLSDKD